jgi:hypothetical protein
MLSTSIFCFWVKTQYGGGGEDCYRIVLFFKGTCLNFNHVNIMKDFHNVFAFMSSKPKEMKCHESCILFMSYTFEGQFCALMIQFENIIYFLCEYSHLLHIPSFLEMTCFSKITLHFTCVLKKRKETCIDSSSHTKFNLEIVHLSLHLIVSNPFIFGEYNNLFVHIPSCHHHNTICKDDFFEFVYQAFVAWGHRGAL